MIQDIRPHVFRNPYDPARRPMPDDRVVYYNKKQVLCREGADLLPQVREFSDLPEPVYLFSVDDTAYFLTREAPSPVPEGCSFKSIGEVRKTGLADKHQFFAMVTGAHLTRWYRDNRYCGTCGKMTVHSGRERALVCPACGRTIYPRIMPAVIVAVVHGDEVILTKYNRENVTHYALVAGFTEIGETFEETVEREVMEEVGLKVKNITYYKSQPWGMADDILAGFFCEADGDLTIRMDEGELKVAKWTRREDVELQEDDFSLTNEMMTLFKEGRDPFARRRHE